MKMIHLVPAALVLLTGLSLSTAAPAQVQAGAVCTAAGLNVHMATFDALKYDLRVAGMLTLVESPGTTVQIRTAPAPTYPMVNAVALRFGQTVYLLDAAQGVRLVSAAGTGVTPQTTSTGATLTLQDGSQLRAASATSSTGAKVWNVTVLLPGSQMGRVTGLCGKFDGNPSNDLSGPDGRSVSATSMGQAWATPSDRNLFVCGALCPAWAPKPTATPVR